MEAKNLCRCLILVTLMLLPSPVRAEEPQDRGEVSAPTIFLRVGQRYPIEGLMPENARITPSDIAEARQTPEGILLVGKKEGAATLTVTSGKKTVDVRVIVRHSGTPDSGPALPLDRALGDLKKLPGLRFSRLGDKTVVQGEVLGRQAYQRLLLHLRAHPANLIVLATPAPGVRESLLEQAHALLANRAMGNAKVSNAGNRFFLEGVVSSPEEVEQALEIAQAVFPNIENHLPIPIRIDPTISVRVYLLELSRHAHEMLGLSWPATVTQAFTLNPRQLIFNPSWSVSLQHLSRNGQARILAEPMLAVKSGSSAELFAGGEIPIKMYTPYESKVYWKNYGLKIRLHIAGIAGRNIRARLSTESSQLDDATAVDGVPGLRTNNMQTEIDVEEGKPILLTGLFQSSVAKDVEKVPLLGSIPLLGELFKSRRFREHESELLVALLPSFGAQPASLPQKSARGLDFDARWRPLD